MGLSFITARMALFVVAVYLTAFVNAFSDNGVAWNSVGLGRNERKFASNGLSLKASTSPLAKLNLPNPFSADGGKSILQPRPPSSEPPSQGLIGDEEALFSRAKAVLASDLGTKDESLLADDFVWVGANLAGKVLGRDDYLAAGKFFDLRSTFPDLDYRAHDFRVDDRDALTIRMTARTVGTMRGELRLRAETLPPNGKRMVCPPEAISMTFDLESGLLKKLCSGFCLDRLVGNTRGLCGVMAAAVVAGAPPPEWEIFPPVTVVQRFFGRSAKQLEEVTAFLAPFPETVMIQLAKGVIAANNGASDPDLLAPSFTFCGPYIGPINKDSYVKTFSSFNINDAFPDLDPGYSNFRVDPYDPYRVWLDVRAIGTRTGALSGSEPTGLRYESAPEAASFTFDDDGFCTRLTGGAVMDPSLGNTGGLGGIYGVYYATGTPLPGFVTRPLPQLVTRVQKSILSPFGGGGIDDYSLGPDRSVTSSILKSTVMVQKEGTTSPDDPLSNVFGQEGASKSKEKLPPSKPTPTPPSFPARLKTPVTPDADMRIELEQSDPVTDAFNSLFSISDEKKKVPKSPSKITNVPSDNLRRKRLQEKRLREEAEKKAAKAADAKRTQQQKMKAAAEAKRERINAAAEAKRKREDELKAAAEAKRKREEEQRAAAEAKRKEAELKRKEAAAKRAAQTAAVEAKRKEAAEQRAALAAVAEAKRKEVAERRAALAAAAEAKRMEAAEKRAAQVAAAEAKRKEAAEAKAAQVEVARAAQEEKAKRTLAEARAAADALKTAKPRAPLNIFGAFGGSASDEKISSTEKGMSSKRAVVPKDQAASKKAAVAAAEKTVKTARPGATISLSALFGGRAPSVEEKPVKETKAKAMAKAPKGIPALSRWRRNLDGSVTGDISGSSAFEEGERITTSRISSGDLEAGNVVQTTSGSKYYLS